MAFALDDLVDNMHGALRFLLAHLNGLLPHQWDWKPSPACRSIREVLSHLAETYDDKVLLEAELARPVPDVARVQILFEAAARADYERLKGRYADTPLDAEIAVAGGDFFLGRPRVRAGTLLARRAWEECYHTGQIVYIRLATDPEWDQEAAVYGPREDDSEMEAAVTQEDPNGPVGSELIRALTAELAAQYPEDPLEGGAGYDPARALAAPGSVFLVAWLEGEPVGCGALRRLGADVGEVKRMFVVPEARRRGVAGQLLAALEEAARVHGYGRLRLETGVRQQEAIGLYEKAGYAKIECYGEYADRPLSVCFEKRLPHAPPSERRP